MPAPASKLVFNGLNAATGEYLLPPLDPVVIGKIARGEPVDPKQLAELARLVRAKLKEQGE